MDGWKRREEKNRSKWRWRWRQQQVYGGQLDGLASS